MSYTKESYDVKQWKNLNSIPIWILRPKNKNSTDRMEQNTSTESTNKQAEEHNSTYVRHKMEMVPAIHIVIPFAKYRTSDSENTSQQQ